jgi:hypothetical protein
MSTSQIFQTISVPTGQSFATAQYTAVVINTSGLAVSATSAYNCVGIIQNTPDNSTDTAATVAIAGKTRALIGTGGVTVGEQVQVGTSGVLVAQSGEGIAVGVALEAGASGDTVEILLTISNGAYAA